MNAALYMKKAVTIAMRYNLVRRQSNPGGETSVGETGTPGLELQVIDYQHSQRGLFPVWRAPSRFTARPLHAADVLQGTRRRAAQRATSPRFPSFTPRPRGSRRTARGPRRTPSSCAGCAAAGRGSWRSRGSAPHSETTRPTPRTRAITTSCVCRRRGICSRRRVRRRPRRRDGAGVDRDRRTCPRRVARRGTSSRAAGRGWSRAIGRRRRPSRFRRAARILRARREATGALRGATRRIAPVDRVMSRDMVVDRSCEAHCAYVVLLNFVDAVNESRSRVGRATASGDGSSRRAARARHHGRSHGRFPRGRARLRRTGGAYSSRNFQTSRRVAAGRAALVDAFALDDYFLNSALGASDGDVYGSLYEEVQEAPFNKSHAPPGSRRAAARQTRQGRGEVVSEGGGPGRRGRATRRDRGEIRNEHWMIETRARALRARGSRWGCSYYKNSGGPRIPPGDAPLGGFAPTQRLLSHANDDVALLLIPPLVDVFERGALAIPRDGSELREVRDGARDALLALDVALAEVDVPRLVLPMELAARLPVRALERPGAPLLARHRAGAREIGDEVVLGHAVEKLRGRGGGGARGCSCQGRLGGSKSGRVRNSTPKGARGGRHAPCRKSSGVSTRGGACPSRGCPLPPKPTPSQSWRAPDDSRSAH